MRWAILMTCILASGAAALSSGQAGETRRGVVLAIHGGAGAIARKDLAPELEKELRRTLDAALQAGQAELAKKDGTSLAAVEAAIRLLEDSPLFNAGKGAAFTREGKNELDASIMDGRTRAAGSVGSVTTIKNPITAARLVMQRSGHVMMVGHGAEVFARELGCDMVENSYFATEARMKDLQERLKREEEKSKGKTSSVLPAPAERGDLPAAWRFGTVGAVAVDAAGNLAAGTSTGGLTAKRHGRIGDSPIIGAGTFADNRSCAVSATGDGEYFIRAIAAHDIAALVEYKNMKLADAAEEVIHKKIKSAGGDGAVIALDAAGNYASTWSTEGLYRGYITSDGKRHVAIYQE